MTHSFKTAGRIGAASAFALAISSMSALAQDDSEAAAAEDASVLPRVLVTAQKRVEDPNTAQCLMHHSAKGLGHTRALLQLF